MHFSAEISIRPDDMNLKIKQLKLYENSDRLSEAYSYAIDIEKTCKYQKNNVEWYEAVCRICEVSTTITIHISIIYDFIYM